MTRIVQTCWYCWGRVDGVSQVDIDGDRTLDFYEFCYLGFMMTQDGAYGDLVELSKDSKIVKKSFIDMHSFYRKYDADGNLRLTYDELEK